jgi:hypothetical protein
LRSAEDGTTPYVRLYAHTIGTWLGRNPHTTPGAFSNGLSLFSWTLYDGARKRGDPT